MRKEEFVNSLIDIIWKEIEGKYRDALERFRVAKTETSNEHDRKQIEKIVFSLEDFLEHGKERVISLLRSGMSGEAAAELIIERIKNGENI